MNELCVIIPVYNEAENLKTVIFDVCFFCKANDYELIWVNDGSLDASGDTLKEGLTYGRVVHHKLNRGYGGAIKTGIQHAHSPYIITIDADGQHTLEDIPVLLDVLKTSDLDMIVGARSGDKDARYRKVGKRIIRFFAKRLIPFEIKDINSGMKLYRRDLVVRYLDLLPNGMAYSDVVLFTFLYQRHRIDEHPIHIRERRGGTSSITTRTAFQTLYEILSVVMLFHPIRIFLPLAVLFLVLGVAWSIRFLFIGRGIPVASGVLILSSVVCLLFGLIAEQLSGIRQQLIHAKDSKPYEV